jgi:hypothetical protein
MFTKHKGDDLFLAIHMGYIKGYIVFRIGQEPRLEHVKRTLHEKYASRPFFIYCYNFMGD